jgi:hypothetical protein
MVFKGGLGAAIGAKHSKGSTSSRATYVPDARLRLLSVKAAAQNGYGTTLNDKEIVVFRGDGTIAASGKLNNDL